LPSGEIVKSGSNDASIKLLAYNEVCFCAVTSLAAAKTPNTFPFSSLYTDALYKTSVNVPFLW